MNRTNKKYLVKFAGICGSDLNKVHDSSFCLSDILTLGHEVVCSSDEGDLYVVNPFECDMFCSECTQDSYLLCERVNRIGAGTSSGGYSGEVCLNPRRMYIIPASVNHPMVGVLCDGVAVVFHGFHMLDLHNSRRLAIIGAGSIGILSALVAKDRYPHLAIDVFYKSEQKGDFLFRYYGDYFNIVNIRDIENRQSIYDIVIEAVGGKQTDTISDAIHIVSNSGSILVYGAFHKDCRIIKSIRQLFYKQVSMIGVNSYCESHNDFPKAVRWTFDHEKLILPLLTDIYNVKRDKLDSEMIYRSVIAPKVMKGCFIYE